MQNHYNLVYREEEREMIPLCIDQGVAVNPWSVLARGLLAGTRSRDGGARTARAKDDPVADEFYGDIDLFWPVIERLQGVAAERGVPPAQIAVAWLLHKPGVTAPIVGATKPQHVSDAVAAAGLALTADEIARLEAPYAPLPVIGHAVQPGART
jgi:aryl-alcohol dehydrogenase-like predicted oxidoreductase